MDLNIEKNTEIPPILIFTFPPIANFWRRLGAWLIDIILLGIVGQIFALSFSPFWFKIGPYGRLFGFVLTILYFGLMNSRAGHGQTLGKRVLGIAVRDENNQPISFWHSLARIFIISLPILLNRWALPGVLNISWIGSIFTIIIFGLGSAVLYTMIFNKGTRQGLHDLICKTYVAFLKGNSIERFPISSKIHWIISGVLVFLTLIMIPIGNLLSSRIIPKAALTQLAPLYQVLQNDSRFFSASVNDNRFYSSNGQALHILQIQVWNKGRTGSNEREALLSEIAEITIGNIENIDQYDLLKITITSAYDLLVASGNVSYSDSEKISTWRDRLANQSP